MLEENQKVVDSTSLHDYYKLTHKLILTTARPPLFYKGLCRELLSSDEAIGDICRKLIEADIDFNGIGTRHGFRKQRVIYAIRSWLIRDKKIRYKKFPTKSIDFEGGKNYENKLDKKNRDPLQILIDKEDRAFFDNEASKMPPKYNACYKLRHDDHLVLEDIAKSVNLSRERVRQILKKTHESIKFAYEHRT